MFYFLVDLYGKFLRHMNNTTSSGIFTEQLWLRCLRLALYPSVFVVGVVGNILVCSLFLLRKKNRTINAYFILNLAFSDLLTLLLYLPFDLAYLENSWQWPFGSFLCKFINILSSVSITVSGSTLIAIAVDRHNAIVHGLRRRLCNKSIVVMSVVLIWIYAVSLQMPFMFALQLIPGRECLVDLSWWPSEDAVQMTYFFTTFVPKFLIPAICISACYVGIVVHLRHHHKNLTKRGICKAGQHFTEVRTQQNKKTTKLLTGLVTIYTVCILPHQVVLLMVIFNNEYLSSPYMREVHEFARFLTTANCCLNPLLYSAISRSFRNDVKAVLRRRVGSSTHNSVFNK